MSYSRVSSDDNEAELDFLEQKTSSQHQQRVRGYLTENIWLLTAKITTAFNILLAATLILLALGPRRNVNCVPGPPPPWSPVTKDITLRTINIEYKPEKIFQSPTSDEVEAAWEGWLDEYDHLVILPTVETKDRLRPTVDAFLDPGYSVYGLAVYHQMHCLNHIRKTFYGSKFFPDVKPEMVEFHKNHCFDMIRQAILCHGDISMLHWWNDTYSYVDEQGRFQLTDHYYELTPSERAEGTFAKWDAKVQCRDLGPIHAWSKEHAMEDDKYAATVGIPRRRRGLAEE